MFALPMSEMPAASAAISAAAAAAAGDKKERRRFDHREPIKPEGLPDFWEWACDCLMPGQPECQ